MIRLLAQTVTLLALLAGVATAGAWGLHLWLTPITIYPPPAGTTDKRAPRTVADVPSVSLAAFSETLARPVFFEGRRYPQPKPRKIEAPPRKPQPAPPPPSPRPKPKPVKLPDGIKLLGVFVQSDRRKALVEVPPQQAQWFKVGDKVSAWTITGIEENRIVLKHSVQSATLPLYSDGARK